MTQKQLDDAVASWQLTFDHCVREEAACLVRYHEALKQRANAQEHHLIAKMEADRNRKGTP